ncbi:MAG: CBS domain-containing protein, partial [Solirubrobacterales bacterium]|nr:CBS domain-containing protein [Solirubrobacterales bacterium]
LSPRAACRLEALGFAEVYDYVPGKVDWLAHGLPVEGDRADPPTAGSVVRDDVARCAADEIVARVLEAVEASSYPFALVTGETGMLLGRVRASALRKHDGEVPVGEIMELGPSTVRPHRAAGELAESLAERDLRWAIVTTPEGRLLGVASREDLERATGSRGEDA